MSFINVFFSKKQEYIPKSGRIKIDQDYKKFERTLHLFCESEDDYEFYRHAIKQYYPNYVIYHYDQKGKDNVIKSYYQLDWRKYSKSRVLFFIDKDYDDITHKTNPKTRNFFITTYYSIENYIVNEAVLDIIMKRIYGLDNKELRCDVIKKFNKSYDSFVSHLIPITSCILIFRRLEEHMDLEALKMESLFYFHDLLIYRKRYFKPNLYDLRMRNPNISNEEKSFCRNVKSIRLISSSTGADSSKIRYQSIRENMGLLEKIKEPKRYIRGKFDLWFLLNYIKNFERHIALLNKEISDYNSRVPELQKTEKYHRIVELTSRNIFDFVCSKIELPTDVKKFLKENVRYVSIAYAFIMVKRRLDRALFFLKIKFNV